jgi:hypothetical protein
VPKGRQHQRHHAPGLRRLEGCDYRQ